MLYSLTNRLSTNHPTISTNLYYSQCLPPKAYAPDLYPPKKHFILSILTLIPHLNYQNMTSTTLKITSNTWLTNITLIWKPWMTTSLILLQKCLIKVPIQTSNKNDSQIFHTNSQPMNTSWRNWVSPKHRSIPCHSISHWFYQYYWLMKTALTKWASPTSLNLKQQWNNMKIYSIQILIQILINLKLEHIASSTGHPIL